MILDIVRGLKNAAAENDFHKGADQLLNTLGYSSRRRGPDAFSPEAFVQEFKNKHSNRPENAPPTQTETRFIEQAKSLRLLFQIGDGEVNEAVQKQVSQTATLFDSSDRYGNEIDRNLDKSFLFASVELEGDTYPRGKYAEFTRELNKRLPVATVALFRTKSRRVSIALADRRERINEPEGRAVLGRVSLLREIDPDRMRSDAAILKDLSLKNRIEWMQEWAKNDEKRNFDGLRKAWLDTLDTESLNKRFYNDLKEWFDRVTKQKQAEFPTQKPDEEKEHAVRLITRMLFIWFMKEKGLVNERLFIPERIAPLLNAQNVEFSGDSYYRAVLQNLFFATLNTPIDQRAFREKEDIGNMRNKRHRVPNFYRYEDLMADPDALINLFAETPFINGGLFECLDDLEAEGVGGKRVDCFTDNPRHRKQLSIPNRLFFDEAGLFKLFEKYKFTVEENTPIEREVALDPELLGNVFENLLAEMNPETSETARKMTGSYYTPRAVVNYMTKEALAASLAQKVLPDPQNAGDWNENLDVLLDDEEAWDDAGALFSKTEKRRLAEGIADLKILDPAVGSGAFPMAALLKLTMALRRIDPTNELWRDVLLERASGKAKNAISQEQDRERYNKQMAEIKEIFDKYDSLESDYGRKLYLIQNNIFGVDIQRVACQIAKLRFFITLAIEQKTNDDPNDNFGFTPLPNLEPRFVAADALLSFNRQGKLPTPRAEQIMRHDLPGIQSVYLFANTRKEKQDLKEDDIALRSELVEEFIKGGTPEEDAGKIASLGLLDQTAEPAEWIDPMIMFGFEKFDIVIGNPPYIQLQRDRGRLGKKYQDADFIAFARTGDIYCLFYERACQLLTDGGMLAYITSNSWLRAEYGRLLRGYFVDNHTPIRLLDVGKDVFDAIVDANILILRTVKSGEPCVAVDMDALEDKAFPPKQNLWSLTRMDSADPWCALSTKLQNVMEQMRRVGKPLMGWDVNINFGIKTGYNKAFLIDSATRDALIEEDSRSEEILKPILRGRDIQRWQSEWAGLWLIDAHNGFGKKPPIDIDNYPAVKAWLDRFYPRLEKRYDQGKTPYNLRNCAYHEDFAKEKVMWLTLADHGRFAYDDSGYFGLDSTFMLTGKSLKYLCALLNSRVVQWFFRQVGPTSGMGAIQWKKAYIETIPVPPVSPSEEAPFIRLVDAILSAKASDASADISELESKIDKRVYALYGLSAEERDAIESANSA